MSSSNQKINKRDRNLCGEQIKEIQEEQDDLSNSYKLS